MGLAIVLIGVLAVFVFGWWLAGESAKNCR